MKKVLYLAYLLPFAMFFGCASSRSAQAPQQSSGPAAKEGIKSFSEVITKDAKSDTGVFVVHHVKQKYFYEIPKKEFGKDFLLITTQAKTQSGLGYGGDYINTQVIRWEREGDRILLRSILFSSVAP